MEKNQEKATLAYLSFSYNYLKDPKNTFGEMPLR